MAITRPMDVNAKLLAKIKEMEKKVKELEEKMDKIEEKLRPPQPRR